MAALLLPTQRRPHRGSLPGGSLQVSTSASPRSGRSRSFHFETSALDADAQLVLAQLQQLSIDLETSVSSSGAVVYELELSHVRAGVSWSLSRTFDDFHAFRKQMRTALRHGHACAAGGCPWLENLLVSYFPARRPLFFLRDASPAVVRRRRDALLSVLRSMQSFLLSHSNHSCSVVSQHVAPAFLRFLCGYDVDRGEEHSKRIEAMRRDAVRAVVLGGHAAIDKPPPAISSNASTDSSTSSCSNSPPPATEEVNATPEVVAEAPANVCVLCSLPMPATNAYVMRLRCGHRFHDECVLPKLNEALQCPTCGQRDDEESGSSNESSNTPCSPLSRRRSRSLFHEMHSV